MRLAKAEEASLLEPVTPKMAVIGRPAPLSCAVSCDALYLAVQPASYLADTVILAKGEGADRDVLPCLVRHIQEEIMFWRRCTVILKGFSDFFIPYDEASLSLKQLDLMARWVIGYYFILQDCSALNTAWTYALCFGLECGNSFIGWNTTLPN